MSRHNRADFRIGVLVPFTNSNLEPDLMRMCPPGCALHFHRTGGYDVDEIPGADQMADLGELDLSHDLAMIAGARPDILLYGCTSATLTHGASFDRELAAKIQKASGATTITAAGALVLALQALNIQRIGFSSPYVGGINQFAVDFLEQGGIETVKRADIGRELGCFGQGELSPEEVYQLALQADDPNAQAIVLSCTDMRSVEAIDRIEATIDKAVVTSNQAMMFCLCQKLGLLPHVGHPGRLFDLLRH
ncbi:Asp/Glu racemase [Planktomarina sp.]|nr:Asp/Glu racemase [Planktomarina sp.]MDB4841966.1 Asp/Glu racemase [Planktomarina sp.]